MSQDIDRDAGLTGAGPAASAMPAPAGDTPVMPAGRRPVALRRSWLFVPGLAGPAQDAGLAARPDVLVADLEEFTAPADRPLARQRIATLMSECRAAGVVGAVRINRLEADGNEDLAGVMAGAPDVVFLPFAESVAQIQALAAALDAAEAAHGVRAGSTEIVPTLESALGVLRAYDILMASPRVTACLLAAEDLTQDLGAERGPDGTELAHLRARFAVDCAAARRVAIDCPFNFSDPVALAADLAWARRIGLRAKCATRPAQVAAVHAALTPAPEDVARAADHVARHEAARCGQAPAGDPVDPPIYNTARRLLARHADFQAWAAKAAPPDSNQE